MKSPPHTPLRVSALSPIRRCIAIFIPAFSVHTHLRLHRDTAVCRRKPKTREQVSSSQEEPATRDSHSHTAHDRRSPTMTGARTSTDSARVRSLRSGIQLFCVDMRCTDVPLRKAHRGPQCSTGSRPTNLAMIGKSRVQGCSLMGYTVRTSVLADIQR